MKEKKPINLEIGKNVKQVRENKLYPAEWTLIV